MQTPHSSRPTDDTISSFIGFWECRGSDALELVLSIPKARCSLRLLAIGRLSSRRSPPCLWRHLRALVAISQPWTKQSYVSAGIKSSNELLDPGTFLFSSWEPSGSLFFEQDNFELSSFSGDFSFLFGGITTDFQNDHSLFSCHVTPQLSLVNSEDSTDDALATVNTLTTEGILTTRRTVQAENITMRAYSSLSDTDSSFSSSSTKDLPAIHCSWPSCKESFSSRRDYKSVTHPFSEIITN